MESNKYDLLEWVADMLYKNRFSDEFCEHCMFLRDGKCVDCHNKQKLIKELIKKYNL